MEAAARQLGVSVKTVSRWVGGATEPRLRDLRRIRELFGDIPFPFPHIPPRASPRPTPTRPPPRSAYGGAMADITGSSTGSGRTRGAWSVKTSRAGLAAKVGHDLELDRSPAGRRTSRSPAPATAALRRPRSPPSLISASLSRPRGQRRRPPAHRLRSPGHRVDHAQDPPRRRVGHGHLPLNPGHSLRRRRRDRGDAHAQRPVPARPAASDQPGARPLPGDAPVVQSAFGIKPYTGFFGALKLRDEVTAEFELDLNRS